jgi:putative heme-binding domain-containing protein
MGLAQSPSGENWQLLVQSLGILEGAAAGEVLTRLASVDRKPDGPEPIRQAILCGLRTRERAATQAVRLLEKWTGETASEKQDSWDSALAKWQAWFAQKYPDHPEARLPVDPAGSQWTFQELLTMLDSPAAAHGNPQRGAAVYQSAQCAKCHRFGSLGERVGPDLTTISQRFHKKEILESILFPSHIISDQYASKSIVTTDGRTMTGIVTKPGPDSVVLVDPRGEKIEIPAGDVEKIQPSRQSVMPDGLLDSLTPDQIADLFAYLSHPPTTVVTTRRQVRPAR